MKLKLKFQRRKKNIEQQQEELRSSTSSLEDLLLVAGIAEDKITNKMAINIPSVSACIDLISSTVAILEIKLYKDEGDKVTEVLGDKRLTLLNYETGDTLDSFQFKKAIVTDYLIQGNGYAFINKERGSIRSLHYVKESNVSVNANSDPIFKDYSILVNGETYRPYQFLKLLNNTTDGATGEGIIKRNPQLLAVAYNSLLYENKLSKTGGNKKGFIKSSSSKLEQSAIDKLKEQWNKMYSGNSENCVVLNKGLDFQESSATSTEMQLNENKITNGDEACKILHVPPSLIGGDGKANETDFDKFFKMAILPILKALETALNRDFLLEKEKGLFYFAFDVKEITKGDIEKRFKAYEIGIKNKIMGVNEARYEENLPKIEALEDTIILGLNDVLYNTKTGNVYTPNTNQKTNVKGGENSENRD